MNTADLSHHWLPFTANRAFAADPRVVVSAEGVHYLDTKGRRLLDSISGLFCVPAGHGRPEIAAAVSEQLRHLDFAPTFQFAHPAGFTLAENLVASCLRVWTGCSLSIPVQRQLKPPSRGRLPTTAPEEMPAGRVSSAGNVPITGSISAGCRLAAWSKTARRSVRACRG